MGLLSKIFSNTRKSTARLVAEIKVIIPTSQEFVEEEIEAGL